MRRSVLCVFAVAISILLLIPMGLTPIQIRNVSAATGHISTDKSTYSQGAIVTVSSSWSGVYGRANAMDPNVLISIDGHSSDPFYYYPQTGGNDKRTVDSRTLTVGSHSALIWYATGWDSVWQGYLMSSASSTFAITAPLVDTDGDGLSDSDEVSIYHTNPYAADTDGDGLSDGQEVLAYYTNPLLADTDGDGLSDGQEVLTYHTNPLNVDTDGDWIWDGFEVNYGMYHTMNPLVKDSSTFFTNYLNSIAALPETLLGLSAWGDSNLLLLQAQTLVWNIAKSVLDPTPDIGFMLNTYTSLMGAAGLLGGEGAFFSLVFAAMTFYEASAALKLSVTLGYNYGGFPAGSTWGTAGYTYGYIEEAHVGTSPEHTENSVDYGNLMRSRLAGPSWDYTTKKLTYGSGLAYHLNAQAQILKYRLGQAYQPMDWDGNGIVNVQDMDWNHDGRVDFQDVLYIEKRHIMAEDIGPQSYSTAHNDCGIWDKNQRTVVYKTITDYGYELEHYLYQILNRINRAFCLATQPDDYHRADIQKFIGDPGMPKNARSNIKEVQASADICGLFYFAIETVHALRNTGQSALNYSPAGAVGL